MGSIVNQSYGIKSNKQVGNYFLSLLVVALLFIVANSFATQYVAAYFNYHDGLGTPFYQNYYNPFSWVIWQIEYFQSYGDFFKILNITMAFVFIGVFIAFVLVRLVVLRRAKEHNDVHGTAHWMQTKALEKTGLLKEKTGAYIGGVEYKRELRYLKHNGAEHILAFAPTRSGKGVGLVLPTLLDWRESAIILDIKGENYALSAGWRAKYANNRVLKFDPTAANGESIGFNPLEEIRVGSEYEIGDVQNIVMMIVDGKGKGLRDYWEKSSFSFITGLILFTIHQYKERGQGIPSLHDVYKVLNQHDIQSFLEQMVKHSHELVALVGQEMLNKAPEELSGVVGSSASYLNLYVDPIIAANIKRSEFRISELMNDDKPVSLYLVIKPNDKDRVMPLVRLIINQILRRLLERLAFEEGEVKHHYQHRLLLMLDEFTSLGKLSIFEESLAYMAGYGIKSYIIIQDITQLYDAYGKDESILSNCHVRIAYAPNKLETAELLSKMTGTTTVVKSYTTTSGARTSLMLGQVTESLQEISRPLLTPDECMRLQGAKKDSQGRITEGGDMLIFIAGQAPIYGKQMLFFKDPVFLDRSKVEAPVVQSDLYSNNSNQFNFNIQL